MGRARNLSNLKPSASGLIETDDLVNGSITPAKMANAGAELGVRNRIINGDMRIDQRNAGASVNTGGAFPVDRFVVSRSGGAATAVANNNGIAGGTWTCNNEL